MERIEAPEEAKEKALLMHKSVAPAGAFTLSMNEPTAFRRGLLSVAAPRLKTKEGVREGRL
jgi:hypothetical protein